MSDDDGGTTTDTGSPHLENVVVPLPEELVTVSPNGSRGPLVENLRTLWVAGEEPLAFDDQRRTYDLWCMANDVESDVPLTAGNMATRATVVKFDLKLL